MMIENVLTKRLGVKLPIIQAPMASATTPEMVISAARSGALGSLGAAYMSPAEMVSAIRKIRREVDHPFQVNLFSPIAKREVTADAFSAASDNLSAIRSDLGLENANEFPNFENNFSEQFEVLIDEKIPIVGFHFGLPESRFVERIKSAGAFVIGCATRSTDAVTLEEAGVDAIIAQGFEAGGHQGTFGSDEPPSMFGLMALVPQVVDAVSVPVIAAGGLMDGRGIAAVLKLGASAAQLGTAFLATPESKAQDVHKSLLVSGDHEGTRITRAFSGRPARGLINTMMDMLDKYPESILPFPYQHALTSRVRAEAALQGKAEYLPMWAGQGAGMVRNQSTEEIILALAEGLEIALR